MKHFRLVLCIASACCSAPVGRAVANDAQAYVLQSFLLEEKAPRKRSEIVYNRGANNAKYVVEKVHPDRLHLVVTGSGGADQEVYVIEQQFYKKVGSKWQRFPNPVQPEKPGVLPAMKDLFTKRASNVVEGERRRLNGIDARIFTARLASEGPTRTEGAMEIAIDAATGLPLQSSFEGQCGGVPCSFNQTFSFSPGLVINPPVD